MAIHQDSTGKSKSVKKSRGLQWSLDQDLKDHHAKIDQVIADISGITSQSPNNPDLNLNKPSEGVVCVWGGVSRNNIFTGRENTPTHTPHSPPLSPSQPAAEADPETLQDIKDWMKRVHITCVNYLLRHYSEPELAQAAEDFEEAVAQGLKIKNPSGFFRSLLK